MSDLLTRELTADEIKEARNDAFNHSLKLRTVLSLCEMADKYRALKSEPEGWVSVPREPTKEMCIAGDDALQQCKDWSTSSDADGNRSEYMNVDSDAPAIIYKAMLSASPRVTDGGIGEPSKSTSEPDKPIKEQVDLAHDTNSRPDER